MCGIAGFWDFSKNLSRENASSILEAMNDTLKERGPDAYGAYMNEKSGVALGHRRLSIVDLSEAGAQPMHSQSGRYTIVFNGEVYNANRLRPELLAKGYRFKGTSDTEVMLACIEEYGLKNALEYFMGMFAFALFDHDEHLLHLVRDRLGVKPLYFGMMGGTLLFSSQPKAFYGHPAFKAQVNKDTLGTFFSYNYIPSAECIFAGIEKVQPGEIVSINQEKNVQKEMYWSLENAANQTPLQFQSDEDAMDALEKLLGDAVRLRMVADVPLGAFLSGGIDSSLVVALMQKQSTDPIKTFSIGFEHKDFDEALYARDVAKHLKTDHTEWYMSEKDALSIIPDLPIFFDEPFADSSQIPTLLVSRLARKHVTVALSGDGGDEFFSGYTRYHVCEKFWKTYTWMPRPLRHALSKMIQRIPEKQWDRVGSMLPIGSLKKGFGEKISRFHSILNAHDRGALFDALIRSWPTKDVERMLPSHKNNFFDSVWNRFSPMNGAKNFTTHMQLFDAVAYLPDDILTKVDRASMAVSLEARGPLLDHRIAEFAFALPMHYKNRNGTPKWLLRKVLSRHLPETLFDRPKQGFGVPLYDWIRGPLRPWAEDLLSPHKLEKNGIEDTRGITHRFNELISGKRNHSHSLWSILMYQAWCEKYF